MINWFREYLKYSTDKHKTDLTILTLDNLNDSNRIIKFIGIVFIFIGGLAFSNKLILNNLILTSIALSGIFFIAADFCEYYSIDIDSKKAISDNVRNKKRRKFVLGKVILHFLAIFTLIIGPYLNLNANTIFLDTLSDSLSLIAIGLTVLKIGMDNSKKKQDKDLQMIEEISKVFKATEEKNNNLLIDK